MTSLNPMMTQSHVVGNTLPPQKKQKTQTQDMGVSKNHGAPKSSILKRFFHYKPSIFGVQVPLFLDFPPDIQIICIYRLPPSVRRHSAAVAAVVGQWRRALGLWEASFAAFAAVGLVNPPRLRETNR